MRCLEKDIELALKWFSQLHGGARIKSFASYDK